MKKRKWITVAVFSKESLESQEGSMRCLMHSLRVKTMGNHGFNLTKRLYEKNKRKTRCSIVLASLTCFNPLRTQCELQTMRNCGQLSVPCPTSKRTIHSLLILSNSKLDGRLKAFFRAKESSPSFYVGAAKGRKALLMRDVTANSHSIFERVITTGVH